MSMDNFFKIVRQDGMNKRRELLRKHPHSIKSDQWMNLYFRQDGTSIFGDHVYETEVAAKKDYDKRLNYRISICGFDNGFWKFRDGTKIPFLHISHVLQMPIKG